MKLHEQGDGERTNHYSHQRQAWMSPTGSRRRILILVLIFFTALGVRFLNWHGHRGEVSKVQTNVTLNYKHLARLIQQNGFASLYNASSTTSNPDLLGHPAGYPVVLAMIYKFAPESDTAVEIFQMILDSLGALIISLIAWELMPAAAGVIASLMAAFAPQFSWNSLLLLPDSLATLPILLAVYLIIQSRNKPRLLYLLTAGSLIGLSCWLRANALLLAPFMALVFPFIFKRGERSPAILAFIGGACLLIAPLTIRNAVVFGKFIPVSLGAGQTLIEGLADYNTDGNLGLPQTDIELIRQEAEAANRSDYASSLFNPDGIARDRARMTRGLTVIRAHPIWFVGVMIRRAISMLRLERTPLRLTTTESAGWLNLFQSLLRGLQKLFVTAIILPFVLIGAGLMIYQRQIHALAILLVVPFYYFCIQSALHTEYRYVLVIHYFLFVLAAFALYTIGSKISNSFKRNRFRPV
jgi:4-amino-4-deoxy-L-arabinose transferase-like glycosyltransferase